MPARCWLVEAHRFEPGSAPMGQPRYQAGWARKVVQDLQDYVCGSRIKIEYLCRRFGTWSWEPTLAKRQQEIRS
jgi:hypothetical protein